MLKAYFKVLHGRKGVPNNKNSEGWGTMGDFVYHIGDYRSFLWGEGVRRVGRGLARRPLNRKMGGPGSYEEVWRPLRVTTCRGK